MTLPKLLEIAGQDFDPRDPTELRFESPVPGCPGWTRAHVWVGGLDVVRWRNGDVVLFDVMSDATDHLTEIEVDGITDFIRPLAGRGFSSEHPGEAKITTSAGDPVVRKWLAKNPVDHLLTHEGGSPRESALDAIARLADREAGLSPIGRDYLGAFTEAQLNRPYQDPDAIGFPSGLTGPVHVEAKGAGANAFVGVPYWAAHCACHFTVDRLASAWELTGNPRALDQLVRLVVHALRSDYYLELEADRYGKVSVNGFYSYSPRMIGWPLKAIARTLGVLRRAAKIDPVGGMKLAATLGPRLKAFAEVHVANVLSRWPVGVWSPFANKDSTGGHTKEEHDVVFMQAVLAMGARECAKFGVIGASELHARSVEWIDRYGWDRDGASVMFFYDALKAGGGTSLRSPGNGVGLWTIQAVSGTGCELEARLIEEARTTNCWGVPEIDTRNSLFPGLEWIPDDFRAAVSAEPVAVGGGS